MRWPQTSQVLHGMNPLNYWVEIAPPPWLEPHRKQIEQVLPPVQVGGREKNQSYKGTRSDVPVGKWTTLLFPTTGRRVFNEKDLLFRRQEMLEEATRVYGLDRRNIVAVGYSNGVNIAATI
ncbi:hypothetical protein GXN76_06175 [Kroppenstedtia pulmonis]|uniref:Alpha/beta hydrolase n=1 Tax=Kroppenstedtia pulmonis TaxID=1380685 RepID=A0A7D3Y948_9BACL|nr:hypothetical protein GXN76_06175 [Kroppenstedtia pulmonis]